MLKFPQMSIISLHFPLIKSTNVHHLELFMKPVAREKYFLVKVFASCSREEKVFTLKITPFKILPQNKMIIHLTMLGGLMKSWIVSLIVAMYLHEILESIRCIKSCD